MKHLHSKYKLHFNLKRKQRVCSLNFLMAGNFLIEAAKCKIYFTFNQENSSDQGVCVCYTSHLSVVKETIFDHIRSNIVFETPDTLLKPKQAEHTRHIPSSHLTEPGQSLSPFVSSCNICWLS